MKQLGDAMIRGRQEERGATIVEAALITPILILIIVSILELGMAFKDFLTVDFAAKEGARVAALTGDSFGADCAIVQSIVAGYGASDFEDLNSITIWQVNTSGALVTDHENVWSFPNNPSDDPADCDDWLKPEPPNWDPIDRDTSVGGGADQDIIGITIDTDHDWITGFPPWSGTMNISRTAIQRLEPEAFE